MAISQAVSEVNSSIGAVLCELMMIIDSGLKIALKSN